MQVLIDRFITLLKWPLALYMLISIPAYIRSLYYFNFVNIKFIVLGAGFILFFIARQMADASVKTSMQIVAHELTHAFFALITFHKVKHIRVEADDSGGSMGFEGEGNWLIIIAPYFFPLFGFFAVYFGVDVVCADESDFERDSRVFSRLSHGYGGFADS